MVLVRCDDGSCSGCGDNRHVDCVIVWKIFLLFLSCVCGK